MNKTKLAKSRKRDLHAIFQLATEPKTVQEATARVSRVLDAKYDKANLVEVVKTNCKHLSVERQGAILNLLRQYEDLFDGTLGDFNTELVLLNLKKMQYPSIILETNRVVTCKISTKVHVYKMIQFTQNCNVIIKYFTVPISFFNTH